MGHNSRNKPGPTIDQAVAQGATHISVHCHELECLRKENVDIAKLKARRDVPVNWLPFVCECGGINISVGLVIPGKPVTRLPIFEMAGVRPLARRCVTPILKIVVVRR